MSRLMSVAYTADAVIERRKTVSRRLGWWEDKHGKRILHRGDLLTLCRKVQGRKPGEPLDRLAEVAVLSVRREPLDRLLLPSPVYGAIEVALEGFPDMRPRVFIDRFFIDAQGVSLDAEVTRIEWKYLDRLCGWCGEIDDCRPGHPGDSPHHRLCCSDTTRPLCREAIG